MRFTGRSSKRFGYWPWALLCAGLWGSLSCRAELPRFDFLEEREREEWQALHDLSPLSWTSEGLEAVLQGVDPYLAGPARDFPVATPLWLDLRVWSEEGGSGQVFFFKAEPREEESVRFVVSGKRWEDVRVPLPPLGTSVRLRIDPPGEAGRFVLRGLSFSERIIPVEPDWAEPRVILPMGQSLELQAGPLRLIHSPTALGAFLVEVDGVLMASGYPEAKVGYQLDGRTRWFSLADGSCSVTRRPGGLQVEWTATDPDGGQWGWEQTWEVSGEGTIDQRTQVQVNASREVIFLPGLLMFPGQGSFGTNKHQALFAGVEYLANEPSRSEADVRGPAAQRLVPDPLKVTIPLMALEESGRYLALGWEPQSSWGAVFDSPDRQFGSGGHLMGLVVPGSDGQVRDEGALLPYAGVRLQGGEALRLQATVFGGLGDSVVPALQHWVTRRGWPPLPDPGMTDRDYFVLAGRGWLDSKIRSGGLFHHAWWPGFGAGPAGDAVMWMEWTAGALGDSTLAQRLRETAGLALAEVSADSLHLAGVGHVRYPAPALIYGSVEAAVQASEAEARALLRQFAEPGVVRYTAREGGPDYAATHWAREANGLAGNVVVRALEAAVFSGNRELQVAAVEQLRALLSRYSRTVPRGAQTWEIPLHTPDILASAHLVRACVLGYELTGDETFLSEGEYWAWTGVPFVYLVAPTEGPVGVYNTIAVLGATGWTAPVWFGQPVQWCGLVYADALRSLGRVRTGGPWTCLADGIALSGVQHTWPADDGERLGLLPDYFLLRQQRREGPAINPATVQSQAIQAFGRPPVYDFVAIRPAGLQVHAAGRITVTDVAEGRVGFQVEGWHAPTSRIVIHGCTDLPRVWVNGDVADDVRFEAESERLVFPVPVLAKVELRFSGSPQTRSP